MFFLEIDLNSILMRLPSLNSEQKIDFDVLQTSVYSQQVLNVKNEIQALIFDVTCLGSFPDFS